MSVVIPQIQQLAAMIQSYLALCDTQCTEIEKAKRYEGVSPKNADYEAFLQTHKKYIETLNQALALGPQLASLKDTFLTDINQHCQGNDLQKVQEVFRSTQALIDQFTKKSKKIPELEARLLDLISKEIPVLVL